MDQNAYMREKRARRVSLGICQRCGVYKARPGVTICITCAARRKLTRLSHLKRGLCAACGKKPPLPRRKQCLECTVRVRGYAHRVEKPIPDETLKVDRMMDLVDVLTRRTAGGIK